MNATKVMLLIKSLDQHACLKLSDITMKWYVSSRVEITDGGIISTVYEPRATPTEAVYAFLTRLQDIPRSKVIVTNPLVGPRRHWRWNGAAFVQEPVENFVGK